MKFLSVLRLLILGVVFVLYLLIVFFLAIFFGSSEKASFALRRPTIAMMLSILGVRIKCSGQLPVGRVLFVGNHISYLDPFILVKNVMASPVSKLEAAKWPLIGAVLRVSGVLFVKRGNANSLRAVREEIRHTWRKGQSVIVYPEGTTGSGREVLPIKRGIFDLAIEEDVAVVPVTVYHPYPGAVFLRNEAFLSHFIQCFSVWSQTAYIHFHQKIQANSGMELMTKTREELENQLFRFHKQTNSS